MGAGSSAEAVAEHVGKLGAAYQQYQQAIIENGLRGDVILQLSEEELNDIFKELNITSTAHRKSLISEFREISNPRTASTAPPLPPPISPALQASPLAATRSPLAHLMLPDRMKYIFFSTHTWLPDELGRDTHARVLQIHKGLQARGYFF
jgi:hypothetical protein